MSRTQQRYLVRRKHIPIPTADSSNVLIKKSRISDMIFTKQKKESGSANSEKRKLLHCYKEWYIAMHWPVVRKVQGLRYSGDSGFLTAAEKHKKAMTPGI